MQVSVADELKAKIDASKETTKPTKWCGVTPNYEYSDKFFGEETEVMELFVDFSKYFIKNAKGWGQLNFRDHPNMAYQINLFKRVLGGVAEHTKRLMFPTAITAELIPRRPDATQTVSDEEMKEILSTLDNRKDYELYEQIKRERLQQEFVGLRLRLAVNFSDFDSDGRRIVRPGEEPDQQADQAMDGEGNNNIQFSGSIRQYRKDPVVLHRSLGEVVNFIINENIKDKDKEKRRPQFRNAKPKNELHDLNHDSWRRMVTALTGRNRRIDDSNSNCVAPDSVYNPVNAFAPLVDALVVMKLGGDYRCCNGDNYESFTVTALGTKRKLIFPYPQHVYRITVSTFLPEDQDNRYLPHIHQPQHVENIEQSLYITSKAYNPKELRDLPNNIRKQIKLGLPSYRRKEGVTSNSRVRDLMGLSNSLEDSMRDLAVDNINPYEHDSEADEPPPLEGKEDIIEGLDLLPSIQESELTYKQLVLQKQSINLPDYDIDQFAKESAKQYAAEVNQHPQKILNPTWEGGRVFLEENNSGPMLKEKMAALNRQHSKYIINPQWLAAWRRFIISRYIDFERSIWHEDACIPDSVKALCIWERRHLLNSNGTRNYKNFSMPTPRQTKNLTPFGDLMMTRMIQLDTAQKVFTVHQHIMTGILGAIQVFFDTPFHAHMALAGPPRAGKSYTEQKIAKHLSPGTWRFVTYESMKAKTGAGEYSSYQQSQMLELYEEMLPTVLGIGGHEYSDASAMWKNLLTKGELTFSVVVIGPDGVRRNEIQTVKVNNVFVIATNAYFSQIPSAINSRFVTVTYQNDERPDRGGVAAKVSGESLVSDQAAELAQYRWQRDQVFTAKMAYFTKGVACAGLKLDTSAAEAVFAIVADAASREPSLRGFDDVRKIEQLKYLTQPLANIEAHHIVFDSELSTVKDLDWHPVHFLQLMPYWRTTVEHAVFAIGLIEHQFEDKIKINVLQTLISNIFTEEATSAPTGLITADSYIPRSTAAAATTSSSRFRQSTLDERTADLLTPEVYEDFNNDQLDMKYDSSIRLKREGQYITVELSRFGLSATTSKRHHDEQNHGKGEASNTILNKLANILASKMRPTPAQGDIIHALQELTQKLMPCDHVVDEVTGRKYTNKIPVLEVDTLNNKLKILRNFVKEATQMQGKLKQLITKELSHPHAHATELLYGAPQEQFPGLLDTIKIRPNRKAEPLKLINPNYFGQAIRQACEESIAGVTQNRVHQPITLDWDDMFASHRNLEIDCDLDDYFTLYYNSNLHYTQDELKLDKETELPFNHPLVIKKRVNKIMASSRRQLKEYPDQFKTVLGKRCTSAKMSSSIKRFRDKTKGIVREREVQQEEEPIEEEEEQFEPDLEMLDSEAEIESYEQEEKRNRHSKAVAERKEPDNNRFMHFAFDD